MRLPITLATCVLSILLGAAASPVRHDAEGLRVRKREVPSTHALHERHLPQRKNAWTKRDRLPSDYVLPLRIGIKHADDVLQAGHDRLMELSDPAHDDYGKHMTAEEVIDFFAPDQKRVDLVVDWLVSEGFSREKIGHSVNKQWVMLDAPAERVEELLYADFYVWEHESSGSRDIACEEYHLPTHVQEHVDYVTPGIRMRAKRSKPKFSMTPLDVETREDGGDEKRAAHMGVQPHQFQELPALPRFNSTNCDTYLRAECIRAQYDIPVGKTAQAGNKMGIFDTDYDWWSKKDLGMYWKNVYPTIPQKTYPENRLVDGAAGAAEDPVDPPAIPGSEAALDFESAWPLIWPQQMVFWGVDDQHYQYEEYFNYTDPHIPQAAYNTWLDAMDGSYCTYSAYGETGDCHKAECGPDPIYPDYTVPGGYPFKEMCGVYKPTNVASLSYAIFEDAFPAYYQKRQCNEFMKLSLQGVTIVESAGDFGVGAPGYCDGKDGDIFTPLTANNCPYVLSVGGTELVNNGSKPTQPFQKLTEIAVTRFPGGSGFSNVFQRPSYQDTAVTHYLENAPKLPPSYAAFPDRNFSNITSGVFNRLGRAYPDVAAVADRYIIAYNQSWWTIGGTSLSAPVWGAVITLINEERLANGRSTLGFIHPILYAHPEVFNNDIPGNMIGCTHGDPVNDPAFVALPGAWDPITGLGSINYPKLSKLLCGV